MMKFYADQYRVEREFQSRDWVYLKLQSYKQQSIVAINLKLCSRYYGPYQIIERIGQAAYELELPYCSKIHLIFHISLLKKKIGNGEVPILVIPDVDESQQWHDIPHTVLQTRIIKRNYQAIT